MHLATRLCAVAAFALTACAISPDVTPLPESMPDAGIDIPDAIAPPPPVDAENGMDAALVDAGGFPDAAPFQSILGWNRIDGIPLTIDENATMFVQLPPLENEVVIEGWGIESDDLSPSTTVKMALYTGALDGSQTPEQFIDESFEFSADFLFVPGSGRIISPGSYWLAIVTNRTFQIGTQFDVTVLCSTPELTFDQPFPQAFSDLSSSGCQEDFIPEAPTVYILVSNLTDMTEALP